MIDVPSMIIFFRPKAFEMKIVIMAPTKQPKLYEATAIPCLFALSEDRPGLFSKILSSVLILG